MFLGACSSGHLQIRAHRPRQEAARVTASGPFRGSGACRCSEACPERRAHRTASRVGESGRANHRSEQISCGASCEAHSLESRIRTHRECWDHQNWKSLPDGPRSRLRTRPGRRTGVRTFVRTHAVTPWGPRCDARKQPVRAKARGGRGAVRRAGRRLERLRGDFGRSHAAAKLALPTLSRSYRACRCRRCTCNHRRRRGANAALRRPDRRSRQRRSLRLNQVSRRGGANAGLWRRAGSGTRGPPMSRRRRCMMRPIDVGWPMRSAAL
ncbi:hypothetical protein SAMN02745121_00240 [Nannocystis exedens]|uniref:Uncharacterized protein n=1 Tax=Nannocystis exedens TaxID=54 RepID=A0A1I1SXE7_9BACT|nr:hypothetical protein NAEX_08812 [Nannocystis exedens]SFD49448.1 hypothetical protein SAMN02745121_00240 [Nannocystis exedens]